MVSTKQSFLYEIPLGSLPKCLSVSSSIKTLFQFACEYKEDVVTNLIIFHDLCVGDVRPDPARTCQISFFS